MSGDDPKPATGDFFPAERPVVDPGSVDAKAPEPASGKRKRTGGSARIRAGTPKVQVEVRSLDLSKLERLFVGVHLLLAQNTNTPELAITQVEAHDFANNSRRGAEGHQPSVVLKLHDDVTKDRDPAAPRQRGCQPIVLAPT